MRVSNDWYARRRLHAALLLPLLLAAGAAGAAPAAADDPLGTKVPARSDGDRPYESYGAAALEIVAFQAALNRVDHAFVRPDDYGVSVGSVRRNLRSSWVVDRDPFEINQLGHPYQGSMYFGLGRSNGLTFWESLGAAFAGSAVWELAGETTPPSRNDQITTSFGGSFLGESLYRMANLVLEQGYGLAPPWREAAAAVVSPPLGFNRYVRPGHGSGIWNSNDPAVYARLQLGLGGISRRIVGPSLAPRRNEVAADFALDYGLPGKSGYTYRRPFDYFLFRLRLSNVQGVESLASRGLLFGAPYAASRDLRGIVGLYGSYDYLAPEVFRVASTGLSLGSNAQLWLADGVALLGHASAGVGYTSTGTVRASTGGQYNYGFAPQAMATLRLTGGDRIALDLAAREFFDGKLTSPETAGTDRVFRGDASLTYRLAGRHALTLKYITSRRTLAFTNVPERQQRRDTVGLYYSYQPTRGFGAVDW
ncbi:DUF3943 domain-containing protein [Massilia sp. Root335]|uniref:DUF3943 domain-containing protein n=1 Tax=Massilia sp. Root335 TaxID=1736517 RepID=UPI00070183BD|nr:DUF3943 domain-containing protein [Massilia sp. Root335]KQV49704.1 hypothetical protein ASC93_12670 [Massilia sp. Root335]